MAAILYKNNMSGVYQPVGSGSSLLDKHNLLQQVNQVIPQLIPFERLVRERINIRANRLAGAVRQSSAEQRRQALQEIVGNQLRIEILYDTDKVRRALRTKVVEVLGLDSEVTGEKSVYSTPELTLRLEERHIGPLGSGLFAENEKRKVTSADIAKRVEEVNDSLLKSVLPTGTLVELRGKDYWQPSTIDPKLALRKGLAYTGRISQFIELEAHQDSSRTGEQESDLEHRAESAVLDLLRQFGYLPEKIDFTLGRGKLGVDFMPKPLHIFAFWLVNKHRGDQSQRNVFPVALYLNSGSNKIKLRFPGSNEWLTYREALLDLGRIDHGSFTKISKANIQGFIQKIWQEDIIPSGNSLVLVDGPNFRENWKWLQDKKIDPSRLWIEDAAVGWKDSDLNGIRLVRIRMGTEVPSGYGLGDDGEISFTSGVFQAGTRVFWGVSPKPRTMRKISKERANTRRSERPRWDHRQPGLVEIVPAILQPGDDPAVWATLVHKMRRMMPSYEDYTLLPMPLHLLELVEEYVKAYQG